MWYGALGRSSRSCSLVGSGDANKSSDTPVYPPGHTNAGQPATFAHPAAEAGGKQPGSSKPCRYCGTCEYGTHLCPRLSNLFARAQFQDMCPPGGPPVTSGKFRIWNPHFFRFLNFFCYWLCAQDDIGPFLDATRTKGIGGHGAENEHAKVAPHHCQSPLCHRFSQDTGPPTKCAFNTPPPPIPGSLTPA